MTKDSDIQLWRDLIINVAINLLGEFSCKFALAQQAIN